jgi:hypothetical protein
MSPAGRGIFERQRIEKDQARAKFIAGLIYLAPRLFMTEAAA